MYLVALLRSLCLPVARVPRLVADCPRCAPHARAQYTTVDKAAEGGCGEPWNLDGIPEWDMQFKDAVLDSNCQLYYDRAVSVVS